MTPDEQRFWDFAATEALRGEYEYAVRECIEQGGTYDVKRIARDAAEVADALLAERRTRTQPHRWIPPELGDHEKR